MQKSFTDNDVIDDITNEIADCILTLPEEVHAWMWGREDFNAYNKFLGRFAYMFDKHLFFEAMGILQQAVSIRKEKGYRPGFYLYEGIFTLEEAAPGEKEDYPQFSDYWKVPMHISIHALGLAKQEVDMTPDEVDIARQLAGLTKLDDDYQATNVIADIPDSYHFLANRRKTEIIQQENGMRNRLSAMVQEAFQNISQELDNYRISCTDPEQSITDKIYNLPISKIQMKRLLQNAPALYN